MLVSRGSDSCLMMEPCILALLLRLPGYNLGSLTDVVVEQKCIQSPHFQRFVTIFVISVCRII